MTHLLRISLLTLLATGSGFAQTRPRNFVGVSVGGGLPLGTFASRDYADNQAGFAKPGVRLALEGVVYFSAKAGWGLGGLLGFADHGGLRTADTQVLSDGYVADFATSQATVTATSRYRTLNALAGLYYTAPVGKRVLLDMRAMGGLVASLTTPDITTVLGNGTDPALTFRQPSSTARALGLLVGLGLRFPLTERLGLSVRADYFRSNPLALNNENRRVNTGRRAEQFDVTGVSGTLGLVYVVGKRPKAPAPVDQ